MADFDQFESAAPAGQEEDPAADFFAREQDQLAGLEDDDLAPSQPEGDAFGATEPLGDDMFDPMSSAQPASDEMAADDQLDDMLGGDFGEVAEPTNTHFFDADPEPQDTGYSAISQVDKQRAEPEKIRIWREEQKTLLEEKDKESEIKKEEWHEIAKRELEDWYKHSAEQFEKTKKNNREGETAFIQERDEMIPGHEWERICRHCEFNPKHSGNKKDVSRMRSILLQLKQTPLQRA